MDTRHMQSFLMISAAFFAMSMPVRATSAATPARVVAAVSHTARIASAGIGGELEAARP